MLPGAVCAAPSSDASALGDTSPALEPVGELAAPELAASRGCAGGVLVTIAL